MATLSPLITVVLAFSLLVHAPIDADPANRRKPRFKTIERTHTSEPFLSLAGIARASRYPDTIEVRGPARSRVIDVDVHLLDFSHSRASDLDVLLLAPNGRMALVMSDAGGQTASSGIDLTLDDDAKRSLPQDDPLSSGRYRPANYEETTGQGCSSLAVDLESESDGLPGEPSDDGDGGTPGIPGEPGTPGSTPGFRADEFPDPAPPPGESARLATFNGMDPSGEWQLFVRSDGPCAGGINDGWGLTITVKKRR